MVCVIKCERLLPLTTVILVPFLISYLCESVSEQMQLLLLCESYGFVTFFFSLDPLLTGRNGQILHYHDVGPDLCPYTFNNNRNKDSTRIQYLSNPISENKNHSSWCGVHSGNVSYKGHILLIIITVSGFHLIKV